MTAPPRDQFNTAQRETLLSIAEQAIMHGLQQHSRWLPDLATLDDALTHSGASFVTLHKHAALRGCIGSLTAVNALALDVANNAYNAAFRDPRFPPLKKSEWPDISLHLSLIGPSHAISCTNDAELLATLKPGHDGLILDDGVHRATFLPSVWDQLPDPVDFIAHLKRKAGLSPSAWPQQLRCYRYAVESFGRAVNS